MPNYNITVVVNVSQANTNLGRVRSGLHGVKSDADRATESLSRMVKVLLLGAGVREVLKLADSIQTMRNKLALVTPAVDITFNRLFALAQKTHQPIESLVTIFARSARAMGQLGYSANETSAFVESLAVAVQVSGSRTTEAAQAMYQFSQSLAKGKLDGEEYKAVSEELPIVLDTIAAGLKVAKGELPGLAKAGKLTTEVMVKAFAEQRKVLEEMAGRVVPTLGQSFTNLHNSIVKALDEANRGSGIFDTLSRAIMFLSEHFDVVEQVLRTLAFSIIPALALSQIPKLITAFKMLGTALLAHPVLAIAAALGVIIANADLLTEVFGKSIVPNTRQEINQAKLNIAEAKMTDALNARTGVPKDFLGFLGATDADLDSLRKELKTSSDAVMFDHIIETNNKIMAGINEQAAKDALDAKATVKDAAEKMSKEWKKFLDSLGKLIADADPLAELNAEYARNIALLRKGVAAGEVSGGPRGILPPSPARSLYDRLGETQVNSYADELSIAMDTQHSLDLSKSADERGLFGTEKLAQEMDLLKQMDEFSQEINDATKEMTASLAAHKAELDGVQLGWRSIAEICKNTAVEIQNAMVNAFNRINEALLDLVMGTKVSFADIIDSIARDLLRIGLHGLEGKIGAGLGLPGFEDTPKLAGGIADFRVGGHGAEDSQLVALRLSPTEHLSISPHAPTPASSAAQSAPRHNDAPAPGVTIIWPWAPGAMLGVTRSREGRRAQMENIETDAVAVEAMLRGGSGRRR